MQLFAKKKNIAILVFNIYNLLMMTSGQEIFDLFLISDCHSEFDHYSRAGPGS